MTFEAFFETCALNPAVNLIKSIICGYRVFPLEWHLRGDLSFDEHHGFEAVSFGMSQSPESDPDVECLWKSIDSQGGEGTDSL